MTIAEVSQKYGLSIDTLRYYERIGLVPPVTRNKSGFRDYQDSDCNWVEFVKYMRDAGISIEALVEYIALFQKGDSTHEARKILLTEQLEDLDRRLAGMQACRSRLKRKIDHYDDILKKCQDKLE